VGGYGGSVNDLDLADLNEHERRNRDNWNTDAPAWVQLGRRAWSSVEPSWGVFGVPEAEVGILPDVEGLDVIELGCGTAYWSAWLARRGARPVGLDLSERQLETAATLQREHDLHFPLVHASAENVPLPDASFDLALSEYGAAIWCEPSAWLSEAHRLLRPGGQLIFLANSVLAMLCALEDEQAVSETLQRPQFGMRRFEWPGEEGVDFHLPHGEMLRVLRATGFAVEALHELQAPDGPAETPFWVARSWARRWPCEEVWHARKL
jgi:SAM-dependent methyltransferase